MRIFEFFKRWNSFDAFMLMRNLPLSYPTRPLRALAAVALGLVLAFFWYLMLRIVWPYSSGRTDIDFLLSKTAIIGRLHYRLAFYLHIFPSLVVLAAGLTQFSARLLRYRPAVHRWVGRAYTYIIVFVSGPAALIMAWYANGGAFARASFITLSVLWWTFTWIGWRKMVEGRRREHRAWMIRSYALTLSAITLRIMQFALATFPALPPEDAYRLVAWPSWLLNLAMAEWLLRRERERKSEIGN